jgi:MSHA pilin protein MshC
MTLKRRSDQQRLVGAKLRLLSRGFTMIELITVILLIGILGAIGASRFFDDKLFEARAYADQAKLMIRYAQKLAIAQNREVFMRSDVSGFAVCFDAGCSSANLAADPGGSNNGSSYTRGYCLSGGSYASSWMCIGKSANVTVAATPGRNELAAGGYFFFDAMGRPHNKGDTVGGASSFTVMPMTFSSGTSSFSVTIEAETGYVH